MFTSDCRSAGEIGNPDPPQCRKGYNGVAMTLIESMSTLAVIGNATEFEKGVWWLADEVYQQQCTLANTHVIVPT